MRTLAAEGLTCSAVRTHGGVLLVSPLALRHHFRSPERTPRLDSRSDSSVPPLAGRSGRVSPRLSPRAKLSPLPLFRDAERWIGGRPTLGTVSVLQKCTHTLRGQPTAVLRAHGGLGRRMMSSDAVRRRDVSHPMSPASATMSPSLVQVPGCRSQKAANDEAEIGKTMTAADRGGNPTGPTRRTWWLLVKKEPPSSRCVARRRRFPLK